MGHIIREALVLLRLVPRQGNLKSLVKFAQMGRGHRIVHNVLYQKKVWARNYEQAMEMVWTPTIEGILVSEGRGAEMLLRWGHFWPRVLETAVNVVSLVLAQIVTRGFDVNMEWGSRQPYTTYARSLDTTMRELHFDGVAGEKNILTG